jgi:tetratricopeptide (TPR) repeat protein
VTRASGRLTLARHELRDLPESDPEAWFLRAAALCDLERYAEAANAGRSGLACDPRHLPLLGLLVGAETELGDLARAERTMLWALELAPGDPCLLSRYALLVARAGQLEKAHGLVALAARTDSDNVEVLRARSVLAYLGGSEKESAEWGPARRVARVGGGPCWLASVVAMIALVEAGQTAAATCTACAWIVWVASSWLAAFTARRPWPARRAPRRSAARSKKRPSPQPRPGRL